MNKIVLAIIGMTKFGKSTFLALLSSAFSILMSFHFGTKGRTKMTVEYHYSNNASDGIIELEKIDYRAQQCGAYCSNSDEFNTFLNKDSSKALRDLFGFEPIESGTSPAEYVKRKIDELIGSTDEKFLCRIISDEKLQDFIRSVTFKVAPSKWLRKITELKDIDLYIRDTKGLLDLSMDTDVKKMTVNLYELGLDGLDGVIFGCSDEYPNCIQKMYEDLFKGILKSVPVILVARDRKLYKHFSSNGMPLTWDNVTAWIQKMQNGMDNDIYYSDIAEEYFNDTYDLFEELGIMKYSEGRYEFISPFFETSKTEYLLPVNSGLKSLGNSKHERTLDDVVGNEEFDFLQMMANAIIVDFVDKILKLRYGIDTLIREKIATTYFLNSYRAEETISQLNNDYSRFDMDPHCIDAPIYAKPQIENISQATLEKFINDIERPILGARGGITSRVNGRAWAFPDTGIVAVSSRRWIDAVIDNITVDTDILDSSGNILFEDLKGDTGRQKELLKHTLQYILYRTFTDTNAYFDNYLLVDRYTAKNGIEGHRNAPGAFSSAFVDAVDQVIEAFIKKVDNISDLSGVYSQHR